MENEAKKCRKRPENKGIERLTLSGNSAMIMETVKQLSATVERLFGAYFRRGSELGRNTE